MERIIVIGCGGAGKSTLSRKMSEKLHIPVVHLDALYWNPGWVPSSRDAWRAELAGLLSQPKWIIDGNYDSTLDMRLERADTAVLLDMPTALCLWRVVKRRVQYRDKVRPDMNPGCREKLDAEFLRWIWEFRRKRRPAILEKLGKAAGQKRVIVLRSPVEVRAFLDNLA